MTIGQLAQAVQASPTYMAKLLKRLARAGLVAIHRGRNGGYALARSADTITLWEVVAALHGSVPLSTRLLPLCSQCPLASNCPLKDTLQSAGDDIRQRLETVNLGSVASLLTPVSPAGSSQASTQARR